MYRSKIENFNDIALVNTMWDIKRLLQDQMAATRTQAHWSDVPKPLELLKASVAEDVLMHFSNQLSQGLLGYDPEEDVKLPGNLRQARQHVINRFHTNTFREIDDVLDEVAEERAGAVLAPGYVKLHLDNPVDQVWDVLEGEGADLARKLVSDVYDRMRAGTPCDPALAHTEVMQIKLNTLGDAMQSMLNGPLAPLDETSTPEEIYADVLLGMAQWHVEAVLANLGEGKTVWTCDHTAKPSRLAGEILADLGLSPLLNSNYATAQATMPEALVLREVNLVLQVVEDHLKNGDLAGYALSDFQSRWSELHPEEPMADVSPDMHDSVCAMVLDPYFKGTAGIVNALMYHNDHWLVERMPADAMQIAPHTSPLPGDHMLIDYEESAGDDDGDNIDKTPETSSAEGDYDAALDAADDDDVEIAEAPSATALLAQAVSTNLLSDFTRLANDHLRGLDARLITADTADGKVLQALERDMAIEVLVTMHDNAVDRWKVLASGGVPDRGDVPPADLRAIYLDQLSSNMLDEFDEVAAKLRARLTNDYLDNPSISTLMFFDEGFSAMEVGAFVAKTELNIIFSKLACGVPYAPDGQFAHNGSLSPECIDALDSVDLRLNKILARADKSFIRSDEDDESVLNQCAYDVMVDAVRSVMAAARAFDGSGQLAGMMVGPLSIVADPRGCDEEQPAQSAPALLLRELETALDAVGAGIYSGSLKTKVLERFEARLETLGRDAPAFSPDEYQEIIDPTINHLGKIVDSVGNYVLAKDNWEKGGIAPESTQIYSPGCRMQ